MATLNGEKSLVEHFASHLATKVKQCNTNIKLYIFKYNTLSKFDYVNDREYMFVLLCVN